MAISITELIDRLGGPDSAASLTGVTADAIRKWRSSGAIPARHWAAISAATGVPVGELPRPVPETDVPAKLLHRLLALYVFDGNFWRKVWPLWLLWPSLLVVCLVAGQLADMRRLRRARRRS